MIARPRIQPGSKAYYRSGCARKRRYPDEVSALAFIQVRREAGAPPLEHYRCRFCSGWHPCTKQTPRKGK